VSIPGIGPRRIDGLDGLRVLIGEEIGVSEWLTIDQNMIDRFAEATGDRQWIHVDPERAREESPFKTTIAHGHLILSLGVSFAIEILTVDRISLVVNRGFDRVRFRSPLAAGSRLRMRMRLDRVRDAGSGALAEFTYTFEAEHSAKPVCVAQSLVLFAE
jgi:acyl dehydratase